jgi:hypothetical protein
MVSYTAMMRTLGAFAQTTLKFHRILCYGSSWSGVRRQPTCALIRSLRLNLEHSTVPRNFNSPIDLMVKFDGLDISQNMALELG